MSGCFHRTSSGLYPWNPDRFSSPLRLGYLAVRPSTEEAELPRVPYSSSLPSADWPTEIYSAVCVSINMKRHRRRRSTLFIIIFSPRLEENNLKNGCQRLLHYLNCSENITLQISILLCAVLYCQLWPSRNKCFFHTFGFHFKV